MLQTYWTIYAIIIETPLIVDVTDVIWVITSWIKWRVNDVIVVIKRRPALTATLAIPPVIKLSAQIAYAITSWHIKPTDVVKQCSIYYVVYILIRTSRQIRSTRLDRDPGHRRWSGRRLLCFGSRLSPRSLHLHENFTCTFDIGDR